MPIHIEPHCSACHNFISFGVEEKKTVWLAPTTLTEADEGKTIIVRWSCNLGKSCQCQNCVYSKGKEQ